MNTTACMRWAVLSVLGLTSVGCGGQSVSPLDPRDATLPKETRLWIADAQDGVIVARARRDVRRDRLDEVSAWRDRFLAVDWDASKGANMRHAAEGLADARVAVASAVLEQADKYVELSVAKNDLANAERAMLHDLGQYDLKPLRESAEALRKQGSQLGAEVDKARKALDQATERWWAAYSRYVAATGNTLGYWSLQGAR